MMKLYTLCALTGLASASASLHNELVNRSPVPGVIAMPFTSRGENTLETRDAFVNVAIGATQAQYIVNITVGTPPQPITLSLDTGSSDTILTTKESSFCITNAGYCPSVGYYNANKSSTYQYIASNFSSRFGFADQDKGSGADGDVAKDTFNLAGATLSNQKFFVAYGNFTIAYSILGLSYAAGENQGPYDNFPLALAKSKATNLAAFSLWKNGIDSKDGQVLFGGVDTTKYTGSLVSRDIQTRTGFPSPVAFEILFDGVTLSGNSSFPAGQSGSKLTVLDCGTGYTILPDEWVTPIHKQFGVQYFQKNDSAYIDCKYYKNPELASYTVDFKFGSLSISVPLSTYIGVSAVNAEHTKATQCSFALVPAGTRIPILGDNFLSSAYTVFDLTNNQISLANRDFTATSDKIVAIPAGGVKSIGSAGTGTGTSTTGTGTTTSPSASSTKKSSAGKATLSVGLLAIVMGSVLFLIQ